MIKEELDYLKHTDEQCKKERELLDAIDPLLPDHTDADGNQYDINEATGGLVKRDPEDMVTIDKDGGKTIYKIPHHVTREYIDEKYRNNPHRE